MNILPTYLTKTLNPALHETRIKARDAVYRVEYQYEGKSGDYIYIRQMGLSCPWWIVATPGFDGGPEGTVLWQVCDDDGVIDHTGDVEIEWTGDVKYDVDISSTQ
jgi:hypothetical protein